MNPDQFNSPPNQYGSPYSPSPPPQPIPNPGVYQPPQQSQPYPQNQPQGQSNFNPQQPPITNQNPYANPAYSPNMQQAPIQPVQSPMMGYNPYPYPDEFTSRKKGPNKLVFVAIIAIVVITGTIVAVLALGGDDNPNTNNTNQNTTENTNSNASKDVSARSDGKLDLSSKINTSETLKQQDLKGNMDEQINLSSGFSFMATDIAAYTPPTTTTPVADGKQLIVVTVVVGNRTQNNNLSVSYSDFRLRGQDSVILAGDPLTAQITGNKLASPSELKSGEQLSGKIVFMVGSNESSWALQHSETYQKTTDNTTFDVKGEVGLVLVRSNSSTTQTTTDTSTGTTTTQ